MPTQPSKTSTALAAALLLLLGAPALGGTGPDFSDWRNGDLVFQTSGGTQTEAIRRATHSVYSHVGIVHVEGGRIIEAARTVTETPLKNFLARGDGGHYAVYRQRGLDATHAAAVVRAAQRYEGKPYDIFFRMQPDSIYCSELPYHAFKDAGLALGKVQRMNELDMEQPAVKALFAARWQTHPDCQGKADSAGACWKIVLTLPIVTPISLAQDASMQRIYTSFGAGAP
jgi:hypothetical protein